ncbi:MAG: phosphoenolpyruvate--protein phosphotransferase [Deltaproteobacteria bacterium]|jgi:phosphotransferase system enzyme I (PtsI)|nr:phosphoenolpyruvate--protein phosphotransferase [Deltaproteobacteria bacterium]
MILPPPFVPDSSVLRGSGVGQGVAIGPVHLINASIVRYQRYKLTSPEMVEKELRRLHQARERTAAKINSAREVLPEELKSQGGIFEAHLLLLYDPILINTTENKIIEDKINAEAAITSSVRRIATVMSGIEDPYIKSRLNDVEMVGQALVDSMQEHTTDDSVLFQEGCVVVCRDISPSEVTSLPIKRIAALICEQGSQTSHTSIVIQAMGIPAVVGATGILSRLEQGDSVIVDAREGHIILSPDQDAVKFYQGRLRSEESFKVEIVRSSHLPARTLDDHKIDVFGNVELVEELPAIMSYGAEGIGLYRTEYLYLTSKRFPSEEELFEVYRRVVASAAPRPVIIRTLDLGADKILAASGTPQAQQNQALGLRAIRYCLKNLDIFRTQLRAILRASAFGQLRLMLPMISSLEEIWKTKRLLAETTEELRLEGKTVAEKLPLGIMVEVPAAVVLVEELAREADFLSIGTNDLIQYTLALDRTNPDVTDLYQPYHPSILRMIKTVIDAGRARGLSVSVCGDMAASPKSATILVGFGADMLSMPSASIPVIKRLMRMSSYSDMVNLSNEVLDVNTSEASLALIESHLRGRFREFL